MHIINSVRKMATRETAKGLMLVSFALGVGYDIADPINYLTSQPDAEEIRFESDPQVREYRKLASYRLAWVADMPSRQRHLKDFRSCWATPK